MGGTKYISASSLTDSSKPVESRIDPSKATASSVLSPSGVIIAAASFGQTLIRSSKTSLRVSPRRMNFVSPSASCSSELGTCRVGMLLRTLKNYESPSSRSRDSGLAGNLFILTPTASYIAFAIAANGGTIGTSPTPRTPNG